MSSAQLSPLSPSALVNFFRETPLIQTKNLPKANENLNHRIAELEEFTNENHQKLHACLLLLELSKYNSTNYPDLSVLRPLHFFIMGKPNDYIEESDLLKKTIRELFNAKCLSFLPSEDLDPNILSILSSKQIVKARICLKETIEKIKAFLNEEKPWETIGEFMLKADIYFDHLHFYYCDAEDEVKSIQEVERLVKEKLGRLKNNLNPRASLAIHRLFHQTEYVDDAQPIGTPVKAPGFTCRSSRDSAFLLSEGSTLPQKSKGIFRKFVNLFQNT